MENTESRLYFASDYMEGAHPAIMKKLMETNLEKTVGYGQDPYTEDAPLGLEMSGSFHMWQDKMAVEFLCSFICCFW